MDIFLSHLLNGRLRGVTRMTKTPCILRTTLSPAFNVCKGRELTW